jgi:tagatose 1,6-diphosphate aldolase
MSYLLGTRRGLAACSSASGKFVVLALDHRQNLRRELRPDAPEEVTYDEMVAFKLAVVGALATEATGVLLDPEVGAAQAIAAGAMPGNTGLIVAVEATGYLGTATDRVSRILPGWSAAAAKRMGASAAKLLVYYHPNAADASTQEELIARVADECRQHDLALFIEPLAFSLDGAPLVGDARREVVVQTAQRLTAIGGDVLKAEFPFDASVTDERRWVEACEELDAASRLPWVLLSGGVEDARFEDQVEVACRSGASGALAGRSVWADAARLPQSARSQFLATTAVARLTQLSEVIERHGRPWLARWEAARQPDMPGDGWYADY